jgi:hypothetical protein
VLSPSKVMGTAVAKGLLCKTLTEVAKEITISHYGLDTVRLYSKYP